MRANLLERMQSLYAEQQRNLELDLGAQLAWQREALGQLPYPTPTPTPTSTPTPTYPYPYP